MTTPAIEKNKIQVIEVLNPLDPSAKKFELIDYRQGKTLEDLYPSVVMAHEIVISLNGKIVEPEDRAHTYPQKGDVIVLCPVVSGSGDGQGKNIFRMIAMIVVAFVAPYAAVGIGGAAAGTVGALTAFGSALSIGITIVGSMLVNALLPPPKAKKAEDAAAGAGDSPTYGIDGPKNVSAEGIAVPVIYGTHRYGGNLVNAYVTNDNDSQFLHMLFNCGEGPVASISNIQLNDIPIENFKDYQVEARLGWPDQTPIPWFNQQIVPRSVGLEVKTDWINKVTEQEVDQLRFDFVCPNGLYGAWADKADFYHIVLELEAQYRLVGSATWTTLGAAANVQEYTEVVDWGYAQGALGDPLERGYIHPTSGGLVSYTPTGGEIRRGDQFFGPAGTEYEGIQVGTARRVPVFTATWTMADNKRSAVRRSFYTEMLPEGKYEMRVRRKRIPNENPGKMVWMDNVVWTDVNEIINDPVSLKHTALLGIRVRLSDQLTGLPTVTHLNGGKVVNVWDPSIGQWVMRGSANPAWIALDAMTNKRYGGGMPLSRFDIEKWKEWAAHCDATGLQFNGVFDQQGNLWDATNPIFRCGHAGRTNVGTRYSVAIERAEPPRMMFSVANMIQGTFKQSWMPAADRANELNVTYIDKDDGYKQKQMRIVDTLSRARAPKSSQISFVGLTSFAEVWRDAGILLNQNRLLLQTAEWSSPIEALACSVGDVVLVQHDMPKWSLAGRLEAGSTSTVVKLDRPVQMEPNEVYSVLAHMSAVKRFEGYVSFTQGNAIFLPGFDGAANVKRCKVNGFDREIASVIQQGSSFGVILSNVDGISNLDPVELWDTDAIESRIVVNPAVGTTAEVTELILTAPLPSEPEIYSQWMFGKNTRTGKPFRIRSITGTHEYRRDIVALEYNPDAYQPSPAPTPPNYSDLSQFVKHAVIESVDEEVFIVGPWTKSRVTVHYGGQSEEYFTSNVYVSRNGALEEKVGEHPSRVTVEAALGDELVFRVVARDSFSRSAPRSTAPTIYHYVNGRTKLPNDATGLKCHVEPDAWVAEWDPSTDPDVNATELRIDGDTWETARLLWRGNATSCRFAFQLAGVHMLRVRHCIGQTDGLYSGQDCLKQFEVLAPNQPIITGEIDGRTVGLDWQDCVTTQPLKGYSLQQGPNINELSTLGFTPSLHFQKVEASAGTRLYWVTAIDVAGNKGAPGYLEVTTIPTIDDGLAELQQGLDEAVVDLLNLNSGLADQILTEAQTRGTQIGQLQTVVDEGLDQLAQEVELLTARAVGYTRGNLLHNGGFELDKDGWTGLGDWEIRDNSWGRVIMIDAPDAAGEVESKPFPVTPGQYYVGTGDVRYESSTGAGFFELRFFDVNDALIGEGEPGVPVVESDFSNEQGRRSDIAAEVQAPTQAKTGRLAFVWENFSEPGDLGLRYLKVEQGRLPATAYTAEATDIGAIAAVRAESIARAAADAVEAAARETLAGELDGLRASVDEEKAINLDKFGAINAKWGVKVDVNGKVTGILLNNNGQESNFVVLVDRFAIATQGPGGVTKYPFVVGNVGGTSTVGIDGNLLVDGTISTRTLAAEVVTADKIKAKSITALQIAAGAITADLINVGTGKNLLKNSTFLDRVTYAWNNRPPTGWDIGANTGGAYAFYAQPEFFVEYTAYQQQGVVMYHPAAPFAGSYMLMQTSFPVVGDKRYEVSAYTGAHRCNIVVDIQWLDSFGNYIGSSADALVGNDEAKFAGRRLLDFQRVGCFGYAPPTAAVGIFRIIKYPKSTESYAFVTMPMAAEATTAQTVFSPYSPTGLGTLITPSGISTPSISALSSVIGLMRTATSGARTEIESNQIRVYDVNNVLRVRMGVW